jgi:uncharacterized protein (DUF427 family)
VVTASWNGAIIAQSDDTVVIEGNHYFPPEAVQREYLRPSDTTTHCNWKGEAHYYDVVVDDMVNPDAAWVYENPGEKAWHIRGYIAFWHGVDIQA